MTTVTTSAMRIFRVNDSEALMSTEILICAQNQEEASAYLKKLPLFWNMDLRVEKFQEMELPKGPSPSILMWKSDTNYGEN